MADSLDGELLALINKLNKIQKEVGGVKAKANVDGGKIDRFMDLKTQMTDRHVAVMTYWSLNHKGLSALLTFDAIAPVSAPPFDSNNALDISNPSMRHGLWPRGSLLKH